ncbi:hypothetical protein BY996DRAFT_1512560 [Phakopsora pachyrhizi]|nr:hypothetical protein BY996DRAFT_1512560 [Phakopsora pachyrhizi]
MPTALTPNCELANQPAQDNKNVLLKDLDLVDLRTCEACLLNADFRRIFRDWMQNELLLNYQGLINLDRWTDETKIDLMAKDIREHSSALLSLYYPEHQMFEGSSLPSSETGNHLQNLSRLSILESGMQSSRSSLLSSLHQKEFQNFLKTMLMTHLKKSGPHWIPKSGFYPCFCLFFYRLSAVRNDR